MPTFLIIGDRCKDVFVYGEVTRLSPEAPVPVFKPIRTVENGGMAMNVHNNLFSMCGQKDSIIGHFSTTNNTKTRYVDEKSNHYFIRVDENDYSNRIHIERHLKKIISMADCIIFSDYNKGFLEEDDILEICEYRKPGSVVFIDTKKKLTEDILSAVDFVKLNKSEFDHNFPHHLEEKYIHKLIITKGGDGAQYNGHTYETKKMVTIDVSGAGDTFLASLAHKYAHEKDIIEAIKYANNNSLEVVSSRGVTVV
jgi:D-beta-D-heptose 7-phosphate kinase/D-beta-D-heptose 1-phosphate adenosyltransferase